MILKAGAVAWLKSPGFTGRPSAEGMQLQPTIPSVILETMKYLEPTSPVMALMWMTAVDQRLGWVWRDGVRRIRWVRIDPLADAPGIVVSAHEDDLAVDIRTLEHYGVPELEPATALPLNIVARDEPEALRIAERELGARKDRWVNQAVQGWTDLCELRGHS